MTLLIIQYNMILQTPVEVNKFVTKGKLDLKIVELLKIKSEDQLADILTKVVSYKYVRFLMAIKHIYIAEKFKIFAFF